MNLFISFTLFALLAASASASFVTMIQPYPALISSNSTIDLGKVGPGQTFYITVLSNTTNSTGAAFPLGWNKMAATGLPQGWIAENSSLYNQQLSVEITAAPNAQNGTYSFNLTAINIGNYSKLGSLKFEADINVTPDVFKLGVTPTNISTGPGQPENINVTINNTGVSDSPFVISVQGLPGFNSTQSVIALHHTTQRFTYPVYGDEPGLYTAKLNVTSASSYLVSKRTNVTLEIQASVPNDFKALSQGSIAFPVIYEPVYAVMRFISALLFNN